MQSKPNEGIVIPRWAYEAGCRCGFSSPDYGLLVKNLFRFKAGELIDEADFGGYCDVFALFAAIVESEDFYNAEH